MSTYRIYIYGTCRDWDQPLERAIETAASFPDHIFFMKHREQMEEMGGISLMYGVKLNLDTWDNWIACRDFKRKQIGILGHVPKDYRLPSVVISDYHLPNIRGM